MVVNEGGGSSRGLVSLTYGPRGLLLKVTRAGDTFGTRAGEGAGGPPLFVMNNEGTPLFRIRFTVRGLLNGHSRELVASHGRDTGVLTLCGSLSASHARAALTVTGVFSIG